MEKQFCMSIRDEERNIILIPVSPIIISPLERIFPSNVPSTRSSLTFVGLRQTECEINEERRWSSDCCDDRHRAQMLKECFKAPKISDEHCLGR